MGMLNDQKQSGYLLVALQLAPAVLLCSWLLYQRVLSPFAKVPGPYWASLSRVWLTYHSYIGDLHIVMMRLHEVHGKVVRIAPSEVSISDLTSIKTIYGAGSKFRKSDWYSVWQGRRKFDLFPERDDRIHSAQRRLVSRPYAMTSLKELEPYVDSTIHVFLEKLGGMLDRTVDLGTWVQLYAFDVIGEVTFSKRFGFMDVESDDGSIKQIEIALRSAAWIGQVPWLYWLHDYLSPVIGSWLGIASRHGTLRKFAAREVAARQDRGSDHQDILTKLLAVHKEKPEQFDSSDLVSMATSNIFAGTDTTAISIRAIIYHLLKNPEAKRRLIGEVDEHWKQGKLSDPITVAESENMPYLQATMYEALRVHPAVGMTLPRVVPQGGYEIDGFHMPAGSVVGVNPWVIHRSKEVYGQDVYSFRPERWLKEDNGDMHRFFFAFGSGARTCIGRNISWMEMSKLIPTLFLHFELELTDPEAVLEEKCYWFVFQRGLNVRLRRRQLPAMEEVKV
ncbi:cytochrome P450 oxidoreductase [Colletotrichum orchidophilum]|uniref:Cytochrome P450 oxidoreductase n=1 Tax=Colletotrichum orchidophilum TaxID=1209926 RepID=A0A1G4BL06_9PEZI|nr:cytochrome P450 oxidoreductase [Colletotrichum orchidophilum]OHF02121.1 cytochrome P450 oxidoreductase [Colletotrichum orchidophilum]